MLGWDMFGCDMLGLRRFLTALLAFSFIAVNAASYSFIAVAAGHPHSADRTDSGQDKKCDTCEKITLTIANLSHSLTVLTEDAAITNKKQPEIPFNKPNLSSNIIWKHTLIASKVQLNC
jgi:hypothetical protein